MDLNHRLWHDRSIFQLRADKHAAALVAVIGTLEKHRPLNGGETEALELYRFLASLDDAVVSDVLSDPYAHLWTRIAFALCGAVLRGDGLPQSARALSKELGNDDPAVLLRAHLQEFKRLALAAAFAARAELRLAEPFVVASPFAIPASGASLIGDGALQIGGVANGTFLVDGADVRLEHCPVATVAGWTVPLQSDGWLVPGLGWAAPASRTTRAFQEEHRALVEGGLELIARYQPDVFEQMVDTIRWIAVNPVEADNPLNYVSFSELPGAFAFQGLPYPQSAAEASIHEFHHNRLFCLEEDTPILLGETLGTEDDANYYSPWRDNLRPLRGVLHGAYVTTAQFRFWLAMARAPETRGTVREFVTAQVIRQSLVVDLGLRQLERYGRFTSEGQSFIAELRRSHAQLAGEADELGIPRDADLMTSISGGEFGKYRDENAAALSVRTAIVQHIRARDVRRQIPEEWIAANGPAGDSRPQSSAA